MQAADIKAALQRAAYAPAMAGIYIKSVTVSAVRGTQHDPVMTITWSMPDHSAEISVPGQSIPGVSATFVSRPSDLAIRLDRDGDTPAEIDDVLMSVAWSMGAWDLCRIERPPLADGATWREPKYGINCSFGRNDAHILGQALVTGYAASDAVCSIAASDGYVTWRFVPLALTAPISRKCWLSKDATLRPDCTRSGNPGNRRGAWHNPQIPGMACEQQYQLGRPPRKTSK